MVQLSCALLHCRQVTHTTTQTLHTQRARSHGFAQANSRRGGRIYHYETALLMDRKGGCVLHMCSLSETKTVNVYVWLISLSTWNYRAHTYTHTHMHTHTTHTQLTHTHNSALSLSKHVCIVRYILTCVYITYIYNWAIVQVPALKEIEEELADLFASGVVQLWRKVSVCVCECGVCVCVCVYVCVCCFVCVHACVTGFTC